MNHGMVRGQGLYFRGQSGQHEHCGQSAERALMHAVSKLHATSLPSLAATGAAQQCGPIEESMNYGSGYYQVFK